VLSTPQTKEAALRLPTPPLAPQITRRSTPHANQCNVLAQSAAQSAAGHDPRRASGFVQRDLSRLVGTVRPDKMSDICRALAIAVGCD
jgi:mRNA-degrading endonuclease toxin of MazEF toxin-antitoxin module